MVVMKDKVVIVVEGDCMFVVMSVCGDGVDLELVCKSGSKGICAG